MQSTRSHKKFPYGMADSWYVVAYSDELSKDQIVTLNYFGEQLQLFRDAKGEAALVDGFCGHMGASLSANAGGIIENGVLTCPFHHWSWAGDGKCIDVPYADKLPTANIRSYPVYEAGGLIWAWYSAEDSEPLFAIPDFDQLNDPNWHNSGERYQWTLKTHNQDLFENGIDWPHFLYVHKFAAPDTKNFEFDGHIFKWHVETMIGPNLDIPSKITNTIVGLGFSLLNNTDNTLMVFAPTPIDEDTVHLRMTILTDLDMSETENQSMMKAYAKGQADSIAEDFDIWEKKVYMETPKLCDSDGPIARYRKWAQQFYNGN